MFVWHHKKSPYREDCRVKHYDKGRREVGMRIENNVKRSYENLQNN